MEDQWFALDVNPDPWAIGPLSVGKRGGKFFPQVGRNSQLAAYKDAVKELLAHVEMLPEAQYSVTFYFWRRLDGNKTTKKHVADATNLQKATEDAIQGVLIKNDRDVRDVRSVLVEQTPETQGRVVMRIGLWQFFDPMEIPANVWSVMKEQEEHPLLTLENVWPPTS